MAVTTGAAMADDSDETSLMNVRIGLRGQHQVGRWTALEADVTSPSWPVRLVVRVPDADGNTTRHPSAELEDAGAGMVRCRMVFKTGRLTDDTDDEKTAGRMSPIYVDLESPDGVTAFTLEAREAAGPHHIGVADLTNPWTQKTRFWAVLGDASGFRQAARRVNERDRGPRRPVHLVELDDAGELPTMQNALDALDTLVIIGQQEVDVEVNDAVRRWVHSGGDMVLSIADPQQFASSPLADWVPVRITGQSRLRDLSGLTTQVPGSAPLRVDVVDALQFEFDHGETIVATLDGPLWARVPYGFGRVTLVGVDLSRRPLAGWDSLPLLCERLTGIKRAADTARSRTATAQLSQTGISDLQTQLTTGLDQFPESAKPGTWLAMGLILFYMLVIGPLDYLLVHKLLKRPHWTWVTFPVMVLCASGAAAALARKRNPETVLAHQCDVVDVDVMSASVRVRASTSFTSVDTARYRVAADLNSTSRGLFVEGQPEPRLSWSPIPENSFRGMYRKGGLDEWKADYTFAPARDVIENLPVSVWSSANATAEWDGGTLRGDGLVLADLESDGSQLFGTLTNQLSEPMHDWFIAHQGRAYVPQTRTAGAAALRIMPGETIDVTDHRRVVARVLQNYLTGVRRESVDSRATTGRDIVGTRDVYDPLDRDPYEILRMVTFYEAGRADEFTSLSNSTLDHFDLSGLLDLGRAVLYCRIDTPAARFRVNDGPLEPDEHQTILRIVLPVRRR